jgi:hypothetical protein
MLAGLGLLGSLSGNRPPAARCELEKGLRLLENMRECVACPSVISGPTEFRLKTFQVPDRLIRRLVRPSGSSACLGKDWLCPCLRLPRGKPSFSMALVGLDRWKEKKLLSLFCGASLATGDGTVAAALSDNRSDASFWKGGKGRLLVEPCGLEKTLKDFPEEAGDSGTLSGDARCWGRDGSGPYLDTGLSSSSSSRSARILDGRRAVAEGLRGAALELASSGRPGISAERSMKGPGAKPGGAFADRELANPEGVGTEVAGST